jgi:hypothetical protein
MQSVATVRLLAVQRVPCQRTIESFSFAAIPVIQEANWLAPNLILTAQV